MAKTKALISCAVTAQLICVFVFAYANCWFSQAKAQLLFSLQSLKQRLEKWEMADKGGPRIGYVLETETKNKFLKKRFMH